MSDLIQRLRAAHGRDLKAAIEGGYDSEPLFRDAADELEHQEEKYKVLVYWSNRYRLEAQNLRAALERIGEQAVEGGFVEHGECPATFACSAIIAELIHLGMPPEGVHEAKDEAAGGGD